MFFPSSPNDFVSSLICRVSFVPDLLFQLCLFSSYNINKIKSSSELISTQPRHGGLQKSISWWILNHMQPTITSGVLVHFTILRNLCTCTTTLKIDILVNYRHIEFHHLSFDRHLGILGIRDVGGYFITINIDPDPNLRDIWLGSSVPCYGPEEQTKLQKLLGKQQDEKRGGYKQK